jgi:hypothetical protein
MTFEELFKKANTEVKLSNHQANLKSALLQNQYFEEQEVWDWKTFIPSLALSAILIMFSFSLPLFSDSQKNIASDNSFYSIISNNKNVSPSGSGENALEMVDDNTKTVFYFNDRNVLVNSEVINNK